jgi:hypothetical protein
MSTTPDYVEYACEQTENSLSGRVMPNQKLIRENGLDAFLAGQAERIAFLETAIDGTIMGAARTSNTSVK